MTLLQKKRRLIERLADSPTALICNAYSFMGHHAPCSDWSIKCMTPGLPPMVGEAVTIKLDCSTPDGEHKYEFENSADSGNALYYKLVERLGQTEIPKIVVIESIGNASTSAVLGDGMAKLFRSAGATGCVTNGGVRDIHDICKTGLTTFGGGSVANHYSLRWSDLGSPVAVGGLTIETGSIVHGDRDGVIVVPSEGWDTVVRACRYVMDFEKAAHVLLRSTTLTTQEKESQIGCLANEYSGLIRDINGCDGP
jgi:4-hydroxy-4-methyl-2-oxoglutarate aldolase